MITSSQNPKIQWARKLISQKKERDESGCYVIEGIRFVEEALQSAERCRLLFYTTPLTSRSETLVKTFLDRGVETEEITVQLMKTISDTESPQGILAIMEAQPPVRPEHADFIIILDSIRDPGNLGTLFRTSAAAGANMIILAPGCTDPYAPKVLRSAMGSHFKVPFFQMNWDEIKDYTKTIPSLQILASDMEGGKSCWDYDLHGSIALVIGSEADGICQKALELSVGKIYIPMPGKIESLNAAIAAGILIFEVVRQRIYEEK
ncbi:MAG: TrmH family RNA methyltransferase [Flexilinea sp.]